MSAAKTQKKCDPITAICVFKRVHSVYEINRILIYIYVCRGTEDSRILVECERRFAIPFIVRISLISLHYALLVSAMAAGNSSYIPISLFFLVGIPKSSNESVRRL